MRYSKYWDDFERRIGETVYSIKNDSKPKIRRIACFITNKCNFRCKYCNFKYDQNEMSKTVFDNMVKNFGDDAIIHITGGEPSTVDWLFDYIKNYGDKYRFHLNTNCFIEPPSKYIRRLKVSLDSHNSVYWDKLVGRCNAFNTVVKNIKNAAPITVTSITCTLTKQNYKDAVDFALFCQEQFKELYAIFFSVYKGIDERFLLTDDDANLFFNETYPKLLKILNDESKNLIMETIDEKIRIMKGIRFPENNTIKECYLSMSERVFNPNGEVFTCSHLYRDSVFMKTPIKHEKCKYGCNRRLVWFNNIVQERLEQEKDIEL